MAPDFKLFVKSSLFITSSTAVSSVNIVITISLPSTASFNVFEIFAPNSFSGSALFFDLLNTVKLYPAFTKFLDIGRPIRPMPIKPIFFVIYFLGTNSWKFCVIASGKYITHAKTIN